MFLVRSLSVRKGESLRSLLKRRFCPPFSFTFNQSGGEVPPYVLIFPITQSITFFYEPIQRSITKSYSHYPLVAYWPSLLKAHIGAVKVTCLRSGGCVMVVIIVTSQSSSPLSLIEW